MATYKNSPLSKNLIEALRAGKEKYGEAGLVGYVNSYHLDDNFFTLIVEIEDAYVEACYPIREGMNTELYELLLDFGCIFNELVVLEGFYDQMAVDVLFEYSEICETFFPTKICTSNLHSRFSREMSSRELESVMKQTYREQIYKDKLQKIMELQNKGGTNR